MKGRCQNTFLRDVMLLSGDCSPREKPKQELGVLMKDNNTLPKVPALLDAEKPLGLCFYGLIAAFQCSLWLTRLGVVPIGVARVFLWSVWILTISTLIRAIARKARKTRFTTLVLRRAHNVSVSRDTIICKHPGAIAIGGNHE